MKCTIPKITQGRYKSGSKFFLVTYSLGGKQRKKKFATELEANRHRQETIRTYIGGVSQSQADEAKAGFDLYRQAWVTKPELKEVSFADFIRQSVENWQVPLTMDIETLVSEFLRIKRKQGLRAISLEQIERYLNGFTQTFGDKAITSFNKAQLEGYLFNPNSCGEIKPNRNEIDIIKGFFNWLTGESPKTPIEKPLLAVNPFRGWVNVSKKDEEAKIVIHSFDECKALLEEAATYNAQGFVAWMLHTGMRPTESFKFWKECSWDNIDFENGLIHVPANISKVRRTREIDLSETLKAWLEFYQGKNFAPFVSEKSWKFKYVQIRKILGEGIKAKDTIRHTRISVLVRLGTPLATIETQMGNSKEIIKNHYLRHMGEAEAKAIDALTPDKVSVHDKA